MKYAIRSLLFILIISTAYSQLTINQNKKVTTEMIKIIAVKALQHHIRTGSFVGFEIPEELRQDCYSTETQFDIDADSETCSIIGSPKNYTDCLVTGIVKYSNRVVKVIKETPLGKEVKLTENALTEALKITYKGYYPDIDSKVPKGYKEVEARISSPEDERMQESGLEYPEGAQDPSKKLISNLRIWKNTTKGTILLRFKGTNPNYGYFPRYLIRLYDKNGQYLYQFHTEEIWKIFGAPTQDDINRQLPHISSWHQPVINRELEYSVNIRDLRDTYYICLSITYGK